MLRENGGKAPFIGFPPQPSDNLPPQEKTKFFPQVFQTSSFSC
jgi:hypothetical protein